MHVYMCVNYMRVNTYVYVCICTYIYIHIYVYMFIDWGLRAVVGAVGGNTGASRSPICSGDGNSHRDCSSRQR
jgi:hypothetical protein